MDFKEKLQKARMDKGYTQKSAALQLGLAPSAIANYECGTREPSLDLLLKMCKLYDVSADYLIGLSDF